MAHLSMLTLLGLKDRGVSLQRESTQTVRLCPTIRSAMNEVGLDAEGTFGGD